MLDSLQLIYSGQTLEVTRISLIINDLKAIHEPAFKKKLNFWLDQGAFDKHDQVKQNIQEFINKNYHYFTGQSFFNEELMNLNETCNESWNEVNKWIFEKFKGILEYQVGLLSVVPHPVLVP